MSLQNFSRFFDHNNFIVDFSKELIVFRCACCGDTDDLRGTDGFEVQGALEFSNARTDLPSRGTFEKGGEKVCSQVEPRGLSQGRGPC